MGTCPRCREAGERVEMDIVNCESNARAVEEKLTLKCPVCGYTTTASL